MPNTTPRSYNDIKRLAGEVPDPVPVESAYRVTDAVDENRCRDLEIKALRRSLLIERNARYRLEHKVASMRVGVVYPCMIIAFIALLAIVANTH